ncbi:MAG: HAMP domain-containing protein [Alphaproteobacteria bacterium]|nr:HAMP domain-containing protein [Alphaproteobacteria bacterium]
MMRLIKQILPKSLFWRSFLIVLIPVVLLQGAVAIIFVERQIENTSRRLAVGVAGDVAFVLDAMRVIEDPSLRQWTVLRASEALQINLVQSPSSTTEPIIPGYDGGIATQSLFRALDERLPYPIEVQEARANDLFIMRIDLPEGLTTVTVARKRLESPTTHIFFTWMVGAAVLFTGIAVIFLRNQLRPISRLARAAEAFGKGRPVTWLKPSGAAEVRQATAAFLEMQERITRQITQRTEMLAGVSHDLRAPLTRMRLELALLASSKSRHEADIRALEADVVEMERMIEEYLDFARGQGGEAPVETDLAALLDNIVAGASRRGAAVALETERPLAVTLRPGAIKRCITNLVDNAIRYGGGVRVAALRYNSAIEIAVEDDGPGIAPADREKVFRPFVRLDAARNPNRGGAGLGLTIARDIARGHGGEVTLSEAAGGGVRVVLRLPV